MVQGGEVLLSGSCYRHALELGFKSSVFGSLRFFLPKTLLFECELMLFENVDNVELRDSLDLEFI